MMKLYEKSKFGIALLLALAMLLQIAGPLVNYAYAEDENLTIIQEELELIEVPVEEKSEEERIEEVQQEEETQSPDTTETGNQIVQPTLPNELELPSQLEVPTEEPTQESNAPDFSPFSVGSDLGNIFTDVRFLIDGVEVINGATIEIQDGTLLRLEYDWVLDNSVNLMDGDWSEIQLPNIFQLERDETGDLLNGTTVVGTFELTKSTNMLKVIFNNELTNKENRFGEVWVQLKFNLSKFEENIEQEIPFDTTQPKTYTIKLKPQGGVLIDKTGVANAALNASKITWTIDVNTSLKDITNAVVTDPLLTGLTVDKIEVYHLIVGYNGTLTLGAKVNGKDSFPIELGNINTAYRIIYTTNIDNSGIASFTNSANITGENDINASDDATVNTAIGSLIEKLNGIPDKTKNAEYITWKIQINASKSTINDAIVEDLIESGLELRELSVKIYNLTINADGSKSRGTEITPTSPLTYTNKKLVISLGNINTAYEIEYVTDIEYGSELADFGKDYIFNNTAILSGSNIEPVQDTGIVTITRDAIAIKSGKANISTGTKKIDWTIKVNEAEAKLKDVWVEDASGTGIKFDSGSLVVKDKSGNVVNANNYTLTEVDNGFKLVLGDIISSYTVTYSTTILDYDQTEFKNAAKISWIPWYEANGGTGDTPVRIEIVIDNTVNYTINNKYSKIVYSGTKEGITYKKLDYENKIMSWRIYARAYKGTISGLTVTDTYSNNGLVFLENTLKVIRRIGNIDTILTIGNDYNVVPKDGSYGKGFIITFPTLESEGSEIYIYYSTSFDPDHPDYITNETKKYKNKAVITGTSEYKNVITTINETVRADQSINDTAFNNGKKEAKLKREEREIDWKIYVNYMSKDFKQAAFVITDTFSDGQFVDLFSFVVKPYTVNSDGSINVINTPIPSTDYTVEESTNKLGFVLTFPNGIDLPYVVEYKTKIEGISREKYTNKAVVTDNNTYDAQVTYPNYNDFLFKEYTNVENNRVWIDDQIDWRIIINESLSNIDPGATLIDTIGAGLIYINGSLKVYKQDGETLLDSNKYTVNSSPEGTGTKLTVVFTENINEKYIVKYSTVVVTQTGSITNTAEFNGIKVIGNTSTSVEVSVSQSSGGTGSGNDKKGSLKIEKIDSKTKELIIQEAEFEIYYYLNDVKKLVENKTHKTIDGKIEIYDLTFRTYYVKEKTPPQGYALDEEVIVIEVSITNKDVVYKFENSKTIVEIPPTQTEIKVQKLVVGLDDLSGFTFRLYRITEVGQDFVAVLTTDTTGLLSFGVQPAGQYVLYEDFVEGYNMGIGEFGSGVGRNFYHSANYPDPQIVVNTKVRPNMGEILVTKIVTNYMDTIILDNRVFTFRLEKMINGIWTQQLDQMIIGNGTVRFTELLYGEYRVSEIELPLGYTLMSVNGTALLLESSLESLVFINRKDGTTPGVPVEPPTDEEPNVPNFPPEQTEEVEEVEEEVEEVELELPQTKPELPEVKPEEEVEQQLPETKPDTQPEAEEEVVVEKIPQAKPVATLPRTGSASPLVTSGFGTLLLALGLLFRRKRR